MSTVHERRTEPDPPERPGGFSIAMIMVLVYLLVAPGLAALLINAYEMGVNGRPFSASSVLAFYQYGWVFALFAGVPHAMMRNMRPLWPYLALLLPVAMMSMLEPKMALPGIVTLSACFWLARRVNKRP